MYLAVPLLLYSGERLLRALRSHGLTTVRIEKVKNSNSSFFDLRLLSILISMLIFFKKQKKSDERNHPAGGAVPGERDRHPHEQTAGVQLQERAVHLRQLQRGLPVRVVIN
jgi:hypothetical protein